MNELTFLQSVGVCVIIAGVLGLLVNVIDQVAYRNHRNKK